MLKKTMKKIIMLVNTCKTSIQKVESEKLQKHEELKSKIKLSKRCLHQIRVYVRDVVFENLQDEIYFFKYLKPSIYGEIKLYAHQLEYYNEKPFVSIDKQKKYIQKKLHLLETKKKKHMKFYRYMRMEEAAYDELYFSREKERLELFPFSDFDDTDLDFCTSHDQLACEVAIYNTLVIFYKQELHCLSNIEHGFYNTIDKKPIQEIINWTASKTDLVELIYALKVSGVLNNGDVSIKQLTDFFGDAFKIDLVNYYKTYNEIRNRSKNQTKFLSKLSLNLEHKLEMDEL